MNAEHASNNTSLPEMPATSTEARKQHAEISDRIRSYNEAYYVNDEPLVPDAEYDALFNRLIELESPSDSVCICWQRNARYW